MYGLHKIPFLRILIPFILGVLTNLFFANEGIPFILLVGIFLLSTMFLFIKITGEGVNHSFLLVLDLFLFFFAINLTQSHREVDLSKHFSSKSKNDTVFWLSEVNDIPVYKQRSVKFNLKVVKVKVDSEYVNCEGNVIAYLQKSKQVNNMKPGDFVLIKSRFQEVEGPQNPHAFDYKKYMEIRSIYHTSYVDSNSFKVLIQKSNFSIWQFGLAVKYKIIKRLGDVNLSENARAICTALITGFDYDIDKEVVESFSHSGTLHILSVSGLHVGLIYLVLNFILGLVDKNKRYKLLQLILISICLWFFALITGFSPPVLRSVIMFNLLGFGNLYFRNKTANQLNILAVSAFIILLYNPLLVLDVGFLLSYSALFGIIYFSPKFYKLLEPKKKWLDYIWKSFTVSFAATLTTLPITLLVFHQFPIWFAFANLVIVPLSFVLLILSFMALFKLSIISTVINSITSLMISFISIFNTESWAFIDRIDFNFIDSISLILVVFFCTALFINRSYRYGLCLMIVVIFWQLHSLTSSFEAKTKSELIVYQIPKKSCISIKNKKGVVLSAMDNEKYSAVVKPNIISYNNTNLSVAPFNYVKNEKSCFLILNKSQAEPDIISNSITHLIITNNAVPKINLFAIKSLKMVVADGSNSYWAVRKLEKICEENRIQFHSTYNKGAFILPL